MGLFHHDDSSSGGDSSSSSSSSTPVTCPALPTPLYATQPINGSLTFQTLSLYIAGISTAIATVVALALVFLHATHCSRPAEQTKIMRIVAAVPVFALISFGTIFLGESAIYLQPWSNVFEAIAILSIFQLLFAYWQRERSLRHGMGMSLRDYEQNAPELPAKYEQVGQADVPMQPEQVKRTRLIVGQYIIVAIIVGVISDIMQALGRYCMGSNDPKYAALWMAIIRTLSVLAAVFGILKFSKALAPMLRPYKPMLKIFGFKAIVGLNVVQHLVFGFIGNKFTPSDTFGYYDLTVVLAGLLSCCEMVVFAFLFHYVYRFNPYSQRHDATSTKQMGAFSALVEAFSPISVIRDAIRVGSE